MHITLSVFLVSSIFLLMTFPAYGKVTTLSLGNDFYTNEQLFTFIGLEQEGKEQVYVIIRNPSGEYVDMIADPLSEGNGTFSTIPRDVSTFFTSRGIYNATAFVGDEKEADGLTIKLEYDGTRVFEVADFELRFNSISDKVVEEKKTLVFTPTLTQTLTGVTFSLDKNIPTGAKIDPNTGEFSWTPTETQGPGSYLFDIVAKKGGIETRQGVKITVTDSNTTPPTTQPNPDPKPEPDELGIASFVDPKKDPQSYVDRYDTEPKYKEWFDANFPEYSSIYEAVGLEEPKESKIAPFVDPKKDPQSYVDRYDTEPKYKEWFDANFPEYSSIYEAVGLEEPKEIPVFVDPNIDPQYYVDRYNTEPKYKEWFDQNYPDITIYEAVGLDEPQIIEKPYGECGPGTELVGDTCELVKNTTGGGCLIATATYGSEMAPQVQFLREIRDNKIAATESGSFFMNGFNQVYYSFSPYVADYERENPAFKELVKIAITPMLASLSILSGVDSEGEVLGYGIVVILLNLGMYFIAPVMTIYGITKIRARTGF